jgi:hypothetical protein
VGLRIFGMVKKNRCTALTKIKALDLLQVWGHGV